MIIKIFICKILPKYSFGIGETKVILGMTTLVAKATPCFKSSSLHLTIYLPGVQFLWGLRNFPLWPFCIFRSINCCTGIVTDFFHNLVNTYLCSWNITLQSHIIIKQGFTHSALITFQHGQGCWTPSYLLWFTSSHLRGKAGHRPVPERWQNKYLLLLFLPGKALGHSCQLDRMAGTPTAQQKPAAWAVKAAPPGAVCFPWLRRTEPCPSPCAAAQLCQKVHVRNSTVALVESLLP